MAPNLTVDHAKMVAVVKRLDNLIAALASSGTSGSYANIQGAAYMAQAVCSVAEQEMATFVNQYNAGFGAVAAQYQSLANTVVAIRNAVAKTANVHSGNDGAQAKSFDPLKGGDTESVSNGKVDLTTPDGSPASTPNTDPNPTPHTTTLAPGAGPTTSQPPAATTV